MVHVGFRRLSLRPVVAKVFVDEFVLFYSRVKMPRQVELEILVMDLTIRYLQLLPESATWQPLVVC